MARKTPSPGELTAPLTTIIQKISNSLEEANAGNNTDIQLESVTASFVLSRTSSIGGQLKIWILSIGGRQQTETVHKVTFELARPPKTPTPKAKGLKKNVSIDLTQFVKNVLTDFNALNQSGHLPDLKDRGVTIELGLTITKSGNVGGEYEIGIFTLSAEAGKKAEQGNTLKMVFKKV